MTALRAQLIGTAVVILVVLAVLVAGAGLGAVVGLDMTALP